MSENHKVSKLIASGLLIPAMRIMAEAGYSDSGEVVSKLTILLAYATLASGHLPVVILMLPVATLGETLLAAASLCNGQLKKKRDDGITTLSTLIAQALAAVIQLVFRGERGRERERERDIYIYSNTWKNSSWQPR